METTAITSAPAPARGSESQIRSPPEPRLSEPSLPVLPDPEPLPTSTHAGCRSSPRPASAVTLRHAPTRRP